MGVGGLKDAGGGALLLLSICVAIGPSLSRGGLVELELGGGP